MTDVQIEVPGLVDHCWGAEVRIHDDLCWLPKREPQVKWSFVYICSILRWMYVIAFLWLQYLFCASPYTLFGIFLYIYSVYWIISQSPQVSNLSVGLKCIKHYNIDTPPTSWRMLSLVPRPLPDFISQPWRKIGRRPGTITTSRTGNGGLG